MKDIQKVFGLQTTLESHPVFGRARESLEYLGKELAIRRFLKGIHSIEDL